MNERLGWLQLVAGLLLAAAVVQAADGAAPEERKEPGPGVCHPDCTKHGNCGEGGKCRCPFGRLGEACEIDFLSPCKPTPDGLPNCGTAVTKSCECMRRCQSYFCRKDSQGQEVCDGGLGLDLYHRNDRGCYQRKGVESDEQYSKIPEPDEKGVECYSGHKEGAVRINCTEALTKGGDGMNVPMSLCPKKCSNRGYCTRWKDQPEGPGMCRCHRGYVGEACETEVNHCYQGCNGRGKCVDQFCHCKPPYFSIGCTRSKVYPANYSRPNPTNFKIYMYELNTQLAYDNSHWYGWTGHDPIYIAYTHFMEQFLVSPVRTEDPSEAHLFFIPSFTYGYSGNVGSGQEHFHLLLDHIKHHYPWWNASGGGRDHFIWAPADRGGCYISGLAYDPIRIVHFGHHTTPENHGPVGHIGNPKYGCFNPLRDVVAVPNGPKDEMRIREFVNKTVDELVEGKQRLLFFAGGVRPEADYSGNTRQIIFDLAEKWQDPEIELSHGVGGAYDDKLRTSKFCLTPFGHGWGNRLQHAMTSGCVPVIVQEHVFHPAEDVLPYETFSVRLNNDDLPFIREILGTITDEQYRRLLEGVKRHWSAFSWNSRMGGQAFEYTLLSLRRRYMNYKALYFGTYSDHT